MKNYVINPAFDYGETKLEGFWIGKFESSHTGCTTDKTTGEAIVTGNEIMQIKPNVTSWRSITIEDAFNVCLDMNKENNVYGLNSSDNIVDPHMVKNTEWGAVAYLSKSKYGKQIEEVFINNSNDFITGNGANTVDEAEAAGVTNAYHTVMGQKASTTGNIYGVYDMSGGNWERTAAYVDNKHEYLTKYGGALTKDGVAEKYREVYTQGTADTQELNYGKAATKYGDAVYETSNGYTYGIAWYNDVAHFPSVWCPFFIRSGCYYDNVYAGMFFFSWTTGETHNIQGFRTSISVL